MNSIHITRRRILKSTAATLVTSALSSLIPGVALAHKDKPELDDDLRRTGMAIFDGYPEPPSPGNQIPYRPALPGAGKQKLADVFLW